MTIFFVVSRSSSSEPLARRAYRRCSRRANGVRFSVPCSCRLARVRSRCLALRSTSRRSRCWAGSLQAVAWRDASAAASASQVHVFAVLLVRERRGVRRPTGCGGRRAARSATRGASAREVQRRRQVVGRARTGGAPRRGGWRRGACWRRTGWGCARVSGARRSSSASVKPSPSASLVSTTTTSGMRVADALLRPGGLGLGGQVEPGLLAAPRRSAAAARHHSRRSGRSPPFAPRSLAASLDRWKPVVDVVDIAALRG